MRKLLLLFASCFCLAPATAQTISVTVDGNEISDNAVVNSFSTEITEVEYFGEKITRYQLMPAVMVASSETGTFSISVTNNQESQLTSPDGEIIQPQFCWPTSCLGIKPGDTVTQTGTLTEDLPVNILLDSLPFTRYYGNFTIPCEVKITQDNNPDNSFSFLINMIFDPEHEAGIENISADSIAPVYYDLNGRIILNPGRGLFLMKKSGKVSKILL